MNKFFPIASALTLACSSFSVSADTINYYVIAKQAEPFQIENANGTHSGIVTDIVKAIFKDSKYEMDYHTYPFNRMISLLEAGGKPNWVTYGSPDWGGVQAENLSDLPIYNVRHVLVSSHKDPFEFKSMDDLTDKVVVVLHGFDYPQLMPYFNSGQVEELRVKDYNAAFRVIKKLPGDTTFVEMASRVKYNLTKQNETLADFDIQNFSSVIPDYPIYLAFDPKMDSKIQNFINKRLKDLKSTGKLDQIISHY
ncbi:ABC-type amino acid transport/signal transduction system [Photobacterium marinum]|uniref:ABC-type amino acid transport/signal transduction system n=1 Tax=Photobacterium marinum TaxID=1056511 RepID=L8J9Z5_9GAMM|nr:MULTISPECIES: transporter substrate-binding domain-containing protein [Photobacterium]ELR64242.1 ABC-type amino acid transport/signal transduction system [Photobacterium marinum]